jgi:hypothetical protein
LPFYPLFIGFTAFCSVCFHKNNKKPINIKNESCGRGSKHGLRCNENLPQSFTAGGYSGEDKDLQGFCAHYRHFP